jgi:protein phosphatase PTC2/3
MLKIPTKQALVLPRLERSSSPSIPRSQESRKSRSEKLLLPIIQVSKSSSRNSHCSRKDDTKSWSAKCGVVYGYAVNSHTGLHRYKKEDRVSIILNLPRPPAFTDPVWPRSSFFALYTGHSGKTCASFLKENLHNYVLQHADFPFQAKGSIKEAFLAADKAFLDLAEEKSDMSGACAAAIFVIGNKCIIANTGNSKVILSTSLGKKIRILNQVHTPYESRELERVRNAGGKVKNDYVIGEKGEMINTGAARVMPGSLQITRAFGNLDAKMVKYGGNPRVVIAEPDVISFKVEQKTDFLLIGSESFFEFISPREAVENVWRGICEFKAEDLAAQLSYAMDDLILEANRKRIEKNVTLVLIAFKAFADMINGE